MRNNFVLSKPETYSLRGIAMIMIVMHHAYLGFHALGIDSVPLWLSRSGIDYAWGYCGTGIFFFLSGYGMFFSLTEHHIGYKYVKGKCLKLLLPYVWLWVISLIAYIVFSRQMLSPCLIRHFFSLDIPPDTDAWFFKVIFAVYLLSMAVFRLVKEPRLRVVIICFFVAAWYVSACFLLRLGSWWFVSVLNFPLGMIAAINKRHIEKASPLSVTIGTAVLAIFVVWLYPHPAIISLLSSVLAVAFTQLICLHGRLLAFIGTESLYFYFLEEPVMFCLDMYCRMNFFLYVALSLLLIGVLALICRSCTRRYLNVHNN